MQRMRMRRGKKKEKKKEKKKSMERATMMPAVPDFDFFLLFGAFAAAVRMTIVPQTCFSLLFSL